jgi:hypothetical protein
LGVYEATLARAGGRPSPSAARHFRQNLALGRLPAPQLGHAASSGALHSSQKIESARFSVWHLGHFME